MFASVRERLGRYEEVPSDEVWQKITAQTGVKEKVWPVWVEGISLAGMGVMLFFLGLGTKEVVYVDKPVIVEKEIVKEVIKEIIVEKPLIATGDENNVQGYYEREGRQESKELTELKKSVQPEKTLLVTTQEPQLFTGSVEKDSTIISSPAIRRQSDSSHVEEKVVPPYKKPKSKFQFYLSLTPSLAFQKVIPDGGDALIVQGFEHRSPLSVKRFGFAVDAGFQRDINRILGFYGGLSFYRQQQQLTYYYYDRDADVTRVADSWTFEITRLQHTKTFDYTMTNIGVRSGLLITLKGDKLKHKFGAGLLYMQGFGKKSGSYNNRRSDYLSYQLFYRNEIRVNDHFSWFVEPTFAYSFISREKLAEPFVLKPYRAGIGVGVLYRF